MLQILVVVRVEVRVGTQWRRDSTCLIGAPVAGEDASLDVEAAADAPAPKAGGVWLPVRGGVLGTGCDDVAACEKGPDAGDVKDAGG